MITTGCDCGTAEWIKRAVPTFSNNCLNRCPVKEVGEIFFSDAQLETDFLEELTLQRYWQKISTFVILSLLLLQEIENKKPRKAQFSAWFRSEVH